MSVYVFRAGPFLIDAGFRNARRSLLAWPELGRISACLLSHSDEDHCGNGAALARRGVQLLAPAPVIDALAEAGPLPLYRWWTWGAPEPGTTALLGQAIAADGWTLSTLHTPGHSPDHFVFHEAERDLVFSADLYLGRRVPVARDREDLKELLRSLRAVRDLRPRVMCCAHRGVVPDAASALADKIAWLEDLVGGARSLADRGWEAGAIRDELLGREGMIGWVSRGQYSKRNLIESALRASE